MLIVSSGTIHLAGVARDRGDRVGDAALAGLTLALGALFLANQIREFFVLDFAPSSNSYGSMYYLMTGFHALHVFGGLAAHRGRDRDHHRRRERSSAGRPAVESVSYYWHFVDVVWILLFLTLFVLR